MTLFKLVTSLSRFQKQIVFLFLDTAIVPFAFLCALALNTSIAISWPTISASAPLILCLMGISALTSSLLGLPRIKLNAFESRGFTRTIWFAGIVGVAALVLTTWMAQHLPWKISVIFTLMFLVMAMAWRMILRQITIAIYNRGRQKFRVIVYGAGQTGQQLAAALRTDNAVELVAFVDDDPTLQSLVVSGTPVYSPAALKRLTNGKRIDRIVLAMPSASAQQQTNIASRLKPLGIEVHSLPSFASLVSTGEISLKNAAMPLDELLGRQNLDSALPDATAAYSGRTVMITGAGGSIGAELCRQLLKCKPARIILVDHAELALYEIDRNLRTQINGTGTEIIPILGSVTDAGLIRHIMTEHKVEVVLHAAAYKHVPMVEANEISGLWNNVFGTRIVAQAAHDTGVAHFILISTDKAVRPTNIMGASKRLAELVVQDLATRSRGTLFSMVRFGNVLGSSGSVIPLFREQIASGGPVTLTHGEVTRYFMTIAEAARLVLLAGSYAQGGDLFVLNMGKPVPIRQLARQMIEGAGLTVRDNDNPGGDIEIRVTGLRPGEKLHEELLLTTDLLKTPHSKIMRAKEGFLSEIEVANALRDLREAIESRDAAAARKAVARWVEPQLKDADTGSATAT
ncbi:polysaccharide biosynthesis protein [Lutimaribacter sp. EGI FJ00015]|uniref:Polysaccharide biosynthesis protein n=1 Tax=Lutimaribacter degradans TaxID=2945989 RepID=A0ACC5ZWZ6_9RHOB|nr:nucleoside-diphosphate sugar epimerase/dehydratase [Lutimaribacter sp. EGI FJ00013]MCM2562817.1 polysaccharide biosynthesis protein [Lutimaribacter sp. EGI FJ00013]MCO0613974.1 polysaccharide biosynthesis protein [Lutimaribacter sp. EGI FJ00015]MCO0636946.1 polysaccharide biosynthesis protein [Lutimaribacter sp. EGI FJ00014]